MKNAYPIVMTQGKEFIVVFVPDFNINTQGKDVPDAIEMARDAIGLMGIDAGRRRSVAGSVEHCKRTSRSAVRRDRFAG